MVKRITIWMSALLILLVGVSGSMASAQTATGQAVSPRQFKALLDRHRDDPDVVLLDVRTPKEFKAGRIDGALLLDYYSGDFVARLKALDRDQTYLVYCRSGNRSGKSLALFDQLGFRRVYHLATGLIGWAGERYPVVR